MHSEIWAQFDIHKGSTSVDMEKCRLAYGFNMMSAPATGEKMDDRKVKVAPNRTAPFNRPDGPELSCPRRSSVSAVLSAVFS